MQAAIIILPVISALGAWGAWIAGQRLIRAYRSWRLARAEQGLAEVERQIEVIQSAPAMAALYGNTFRSTADPMMIPDHARSGKWERFHLFSPYAKLPERTVFGLQCSEPPLAMVCPECDLKQPVMQASIFGGAERRRCPYCGTITQQHGTRIYWWHQNTSVEPGQWTGGAES